MTEWNVVLRGGSRDGVLMRLPDITTRLIEGGVGVVPVQGEYKRTEDTEDGRIVFRWVESETA